MVRAFRTPASSVGAYRQPPLFDLAIRRDDRYYQQILDALVRAGFTDTDDPLAAQLTVSRLFGTVWSAQPVPRDGSMEEAFGLGLVRAARRRPTASALALLRTIAVVAPIREVREAAQADAAAFGTGGAGQDHEDGLAPRRTRSREQAHRPEPARPLGTDHAPSSNPRCWVYEDVFGDRSVVICESGHRRGMAIHIDHLHAGSAVDAEELADVEDTVLRLRAKGVRSAGSLVEANLGDQQDWSALRQVESGWAAMVVRQALARTDLVGDVPISAEYGQLRALVIARLAVLPEPTGPLLQDHGILPTNPDAPEATQLPELVAEFLDDHPDLHDPSYAAAVARLVLAFGREHDPSDVTRVSPELWRDFLTRWLPAHGFATATTGAPPGTPGPEYDISPILRAWSAWVARRRCLPGPARDHLARALDLGLAAGPSRPLPPWA
jgi:hypothetical protein